MVKLYLCGKIRNIDYDTGTQWRDYVTRELREGGVETLDPMRNKESLAGAASMPREGDDLFRQPRNVFARDVWDVRQCDILLADLRWGNGRFTMFEIGMAYGLGKPVILVTDNPERDDSICLTFGATAVFDNLNDAIDMILSMANRL